MLDDVGGDMDLLAKTMLTKRLKKQGASLHTRTKVARLTENTVIARQDGGEVTFDYETLVVAAGVRPNRELIDALSGTDLEVHVIGDAVEARSALDAIHEGFDLGLNL
jgi:2,4-dienoyl-CoA reductase (NADPH2)